MTGKRIEINNLIRQKRTYFDGGFGSLLQERGLPAGKAPELWNTENPDAILNIHKEYVRAGCDFITANTFGVNPIKYPGTYRELICAALNIARDAVSGSRAKIALDIGPLGRLLRPLGDLGFEDAVKAFSDVIGYAASLGIADLIIIETMNDSLETKAAVLAAKESSDLAVFVTNAYDAGGKLMTGASPEAMVAMLEGLGADAIGINCSLGPELMLPIVARIAENASIPVIVSPNAGLPAYIEGKTVYTLSAETFADSMAQIAKCGASILGGCCGTTPEYIEKLIGRTKDIALPVITEKNITAVSSYTHAVRIADKPIVIGERINPTGKPRLKEALRNGDMSLVISEAVRQADAGAHILDVNTGLPEIDEREAMLCAVQEIQKVTDLPLQLDSSDPAVLEAAMRLYNGKPLVNSVNGKAEVMEAVLPLVKKYGGTVIALTLDEDGIPSTAAKRVAIAERIAEKAREYGIAKKDIVVDPLALTVSSDKQSPAVTLEAIRLLTERGFHTSLGVSNVSFGLPRRDIVNSSFFLAALEAGLSMAILNPFDGRMQEALFAYRLLHGMDEGCADYIGFAADRKESVSSVSAPGSPSMQATAGAQAVPGAQTASGEMSLREAVLRGMKELAAAACSREECIRDPLGKIDGEIIPALSEIGASFEAGKAYLPQLLMSAEAAQEAIGILKRYIPSAGDKERGKMILATVKGDIHDIGKNIVKVLLESYGFSVIDLGKDVAPETVLACVKESGCRLVGLSALMTTTVPAMEETTKMLHDFDPQIRVCVGGAVLTQEYADSIGADKYCADAMDTVRYAAEYYGK